MQITNYWVQPQVAQNKSSAASAMEFLKTAARGSVSSNSGSTDASQIAISGASPGTNFSASLAAASVSAGSQVSVPGASYLTKSDLILIKETTGQTIDPKTGEPVDASGKQVLRGMGTMQLETALISAREGGVPNGSGGTTFITGDITASDLQSIMTEYSGNSSMVLVLQKVGSALNAAS